jgi:hypothetical protein
MRPVQVYRVDFVRKTKDLIGVVFEKRKEERVGNHFDLLRLARRLFAVDAVDAANITIDVRYARHAILTERASDISAG